MTEKQKLQHICSVTDPQLPWFPSFFKSEKPSFIIINQYVLNMRSILSLLFWLKAKRITHKTCTWPRLSVTGGRQSMTSAEVWWPSLWEVLWPFLKQPLPEKSMSKLFGPFLSSLSHSPLPLHSLCRSASEARRLAFEKDRQEAFGPIICLFSCRFSFFSSFDILLVIVFLPLCKLSGHGAVWFLESGPVHQNTSGRLREHTVLGLIMGDWVQDGGAGTKGNIFWQREKPACFFALILSFWVNVEGFFDSTWLRNLFFGSDKLNIVLNSVTPILNMIISLNDVITST